METKPSLEDILKQAQSILGKKSWEARRGNKSGSEYMKEVRRKGLEKKTKKKKQ